MGCDICHINISNIGVSSDCDKDLSHQIKSTPRIITVNTKPFIVNSIPTLSKGSQQKKKVLINQMLETVRDCYHGKKNGYICSDPIKIHVQEHDKCSACQVHIPTIETRVRLAKQYGIPIELKIHNVATKKGAEIYTKGKCNGTPCVVMEKPNGKMEHIAEGIDQDIGFFSSLFGIKNPLINNIGKKTIPKRIARSVTL